MSLGKAIVSYKKLVLLLLLVVVATMICYSPATTNEFVNWDDFGYVPDNPLIKELSLKNLQAIFSRGEYMGNYHPLTLLTYNIEYQFFQLNPHGYHVVNIALHLLNTSLVLWFMLVLTGRLDVSFIVALFFGVHPLHVESVAWVSERKDLLYTAFYLCSLICYLKYSNNNRGPKFYVFALILFVLSLLSKAMAASLPIVFLLLDFFLGRKFEKKVLLEKIPFFLLAIIFGVVALFAQQAAKAIHVTTYSLPERVVFASYGFVSYVIKLFIPTNFSAFYPYPEKIAGALPNYIWLFPICAALIVALAAYSLKFTKKLFFGIMFFLVTVFLVLQLLQVGGAVTADRYAYIPSIGFFYLIGEGYRRLQLNKHAAFSILRRGITVILGGYVLWLCVLTWERSRTWHDSFALWTDVLSKYDRIGFAYMNRGFAYHKIGSNEAAISDYNKALQIDLSDANAYHNRGYAYYHLGKYEAALADYNKAMELKVDNAEAYNNRGAAFAALGRSDAAISDFSKAIEMSPEYALAYNNRGTEFAKAGKYEAAIADFEKALQLNPDYVDAKNNRELAANDLKRSKAAIEDTARGGQLKTDGAEFFFNRGLQNGQAGNTAAAINDFSRAIQLRPRYAEAYNNRGIAHALLLNYQAAVLDFNKAIELKPEYAEAYYNRGINSRNRGNMREACADFGRAAAMNFELARKALNESCK